MNKRDHQSNVIQPFHLAKEKSETYGGEQQPLPVLAKSGQGEQITPETLHLLGR